LLKNRRFCRIMRPGMLGRKIAIGLLCLLACAMGTQTVKAQDACQGDEDCAEGLICCSFGCHDGDSCDGGQDGGDEGEDGGDEGEDGGEEGGNDGADGEEGIITGNLDGCDFKTGRLSASCIPIFIGHVIEYIFGLIGFFFIINVMYAGYQIAFGGAGIVEDGAGKQRLKWSIIGFVVTACSFLILDAILTVFIVKFTP
jgi:hypothetical protein